MANNIISIVLSIIAAVIYDSVKKEYFNQKSLSQTEKSQYSPRYILSVKREFYIGFFLGIAFISVPTTSYLFLNLAIDIIAYFSFFVSLMGFMCLVDVIKYMSDKITDDNANHEANQ